MAYDPKGMSDGGYTKSISQVAYPDSSLDSNKIHDAVRESASWNHGSTSGSPNFLTGTMHSNGIFSRMDLYNTSTNPLFNKTWRFGLLNPYGAISTSREFLFFTKPDLHIIGMEDSTGSIIEDKLLLPLQKSGFWMDLYNSKKRIIELLQASYGSNKEDPFNHLLQNMVNSNLEIPSLSAATVETATNMYGVGFTYRGSSEESDDGPEFSLEFKDDRWLNVYTYFRTYEEYETEKHHGTIRPWKGYIVNKIIHDQIAIYKFIVDEDMETLLYFGKYYGVMPTSLPRDVFSSDNFDNGLTFPISFKAAFYEDMRPEILEDFNALSKPWYDSFAPGGEKGGYDLDIYNEILYMTDNRPATAAIVEKDFSSKAAKMSPNGYVYKLKWRGSDQA